MIHLLLHARCGAFVLFDAILQLILFITQSVELFLELCTIAEQVDQLIVVLDRIRYRFE
jgi:hypothetical protein